ncbi:enoyl-CoA hydratase [Nocardia speluncae]|uniref:Enoyl-CoA hydratase n=1 Tax=Nocardia speluncae TaxID=419477 RepID=A0A846XJC1_9NOCA|nr:enoyl-CoA hydratase-related protein [Nocardia speluncae]NKY34673.1 enoyl-CoA hydratase [Nocardia speluncae]
MTELVHLEIDAAIATVTLDSPSNRNALSRRLVAELRAHLNTAMCDTQVRAVIITGTGPVFCAGADLKERSRPADPGQPDPSFADILRLIMEGPTPVVVKMNGPARAGGLGIVAASDIAIAPTTATFAFSEVKIGVAPAMIAVPCTRRMTPRSVSRYFLTGETFDATTAEKVGLVSIVTDDVDSACAGIAAALRDAGPNALAAAKKLIPIARNLELGDALTTMERESAELFASSEGQEGMAAFVAKRKPEWAQFD